MFDISLWHSNILLSVRQIPLEWHTWPATDSYVNVTTQSVGIVESFRMNERDRRRTKSRRESLRVRNLMKLDT